MRGHTSAFAPARRSSPSRPWCRTNGGAVRARRRRSTTRSLCCPSGRRGRSAPPRRRGPPASIAGSGAGADVTWTLRSRRVRSNTTRSCGHSTLRTSAICPVWGCTIQLSKSRTPQPSCGRARSSEGARCTRRSVRSFSPTCSQRSCWVDSRPWPIRRARRTPATARWHSCWPWSVRADWCGSIGKSRAPNRVGRDQQSLRRVADFVSVGQQSRLSPLAKRRRRRGRAPPSPLRTSTG